MIGPYQRTGQK